MINFSSIEKGNLIRFLYIPDNKIIAIDGKVIDTYTTHIGVDYILVKPNNEREVLCDWDNIVYKSIELTKVERDE